MSEELLIPFSLAKRYLAQNGLRITPDAAKELQKQIKEFSFKISEKATIITKRRNQQTIKSEDVKTALVELNEGTEGFDFQTKEDKDENIEEENK